MNYLRRTIQCLDVSEPRCSCVRYSYGQRTRSTTISINEQDGTIASLSYVFFHTCSSSERYYDA